MAEVRRISILANELAVALDGATVDTITVGVDSQPDNTPTSNYTKIGCTTKMRVQPNKGPVVDVVCAEDGAYSLKKRMRPGPKSLTFEFEITDIGSHFFQMMEMGAAIDLGSGGGDFVPMEAMGVIKGWFRVESKEADEVSGEVTTVAQRFLWGELEIGAAVEMGQNVVAYSATLTVFPNALNTNTLDGFGG